MKVLFNYTFDTEALQDVTSFFSIRVSSCVSRGSRSGSGTPKGNPDREVYL